MTATLSDIWIVEVWGRKEMVERRVFDGAQAARDAGKFAREVEASGNVVARMWSMYERGK